MNHPRVDPDEFVLQEITSKHFGVPYSVARYFQTSFLKHRPKSSFFRFAQLNSCIREPVLGFTLLFSN
jgi:hypothetical protein